MLFLLNYLFDNIYFNFFLNKYIILYKIYRNIKMLVSELLDKIKNIIIDVKKSKSVNEKFIINAYENVITKLSVYKIKMIIHYSDIDKLDITDRMKDKIKTIITDFNKDKNGTSNTINLFQELININGIGLEKIHELISNGLKKVDDLSLKKYNNMLSLESQLFYKYKPITTIPRKYITDLDTYLNDIFKKNNIKYIIGGSYRRNANTSSDVDILVVSSDSEIFNTIKKLIKIEVYMQGNDKMSALFKINKKYIKIDFMRCPASEYIPMLLYITGSKLFNIKMRMEAKNKNYILNQKGLYKIKGKDKILIDVKNEKDIFDILAMSYVDPSKR